MNTRRNKSKFKNSQILLDSGCTSTIIMIRLVEKICPEKYAVTQWQTQAGNITTNFKVKVDFTLPTLSSTNVVTWKCHVDGSAWVRYGMFLGRYLLTQLVLNLKIYAHVIEADDGPFIGFMAPMFDLGAYVSKRVDTVGSTVLQWVVR